MAGLDKHQMIVVRKSMGSVFMRMEAGDLNLYEGMVELATAVSHFDASVQSAAIDYMQAGMDEWMHETSGTA